MEGLKLETEVSYDKVRGVRTYGGIRIAFGSSPGEGVRSHRTAFVQRDIDIVTNVKAIEEDYNEATGKNVKIIEGNTPPIKLFVRHHMVG